MERETRPSLPRMARCRKFGPGAGRKFRLQAPGRAERGRFAPVAAIPVRARACSRNSCPGAGRKFRPQALSSASRLQTASPIPPWPAKACRRHT